MVQMSTVWDRTTAFVGSAMSAVLPIAIGLLFVPITTELVLQPALLTADPLVRAVVTLVLTAIQLTGTLALIVLALGATLHAGEAVRAALARLLVAIGILLLLGIIGVIVALPMGIGLVASGVNVAAFRAGGAMTPSISPGLALFLVLYAIAYIVFVVWATARLIVIEPVILAERRGIGAIGRAFALTRGLTWRIVGVLILYAIVATVAVLAAREVFGALFGLIAAGEGTITVASVLTAIVVAIVSAGFKTLAAVFVGKLYQAAGDAHEGHAEPL
jgi:hypothetical protein